MQFICGTGKMCRNIKLFNIDNKLNAKEYSKNCLYQHQLFNKDNNLKIKSK